MSMSYQNFSPALVLQFKTSKIFYETANIA